MKDRRIVEYLPNAYAYHKVLLDNSGKPIDYVFLDLNQAFEENTGLKREKIIGKKVSEAMPGILSADFDWIGIYGEVALTGEETKIVEYSDTLGKWFKVVAYSRKKGYFTTIFNDITLEKETELKVRAKERELREAHSIAKLGRWDYYHKEGRLEWSDTIYEIFGKDSEKFTVTYEKYLDLIHPNDRYHVNKAWKDSLKTKETYIIEHRFVLDSGQIKWVKEQAKTDFDHNGNPIHTVGVIQDITDIKRIQEKLMLKQVELDTFFTSSLDLLSIASKEGIFLRLNPEWSNSLGYPIGSLIGKNILDFVHPDDRELTAEGIQSFSHKDNLNIFVNRYKCKNGDYKWLEWRLKQVGNLLYISTRDISPHIEMQRILAEQEKKYRLIAEGVADVVWTTDLQLNTIFISPSITKLTQESPEENIGRTILDKFRKEDSEKLISLFKEATEQEKDPASDKDRTIEMEVERRRKDGSYVWVNMKMTFLRDSEGKAIGVHGVTRDISKRKEIEIEKEKKQREVEYLSFYDHLTKLYNRRFFEVELSRLDTVRNLPISIIFGDVDGLKVLNDSYGHEIGDQLLIKVAKILKKACREDDIVARVGGDEFAILLPKTNGRVAEEVIARIKELAKEKTINGVDISISLGYETKNSESDNMEEIRNRAEDSMYRDKSASSDDLKKNAINELVNIIDKKFPNEKDYFKRIFKLYEKMIHNS